VTQIDTPGLETARRRARPRQYRPATRRRLGAAVRRPTGFSDAARGFVATIDPPTIRNADGKLVWI